MIAIKHKESADICSESFLKVVFSASYKNKKEKSLNFFFFLLFIYFILPPKIFFSGMSSEKK